MDILLIEPFFTGSHKAWAEGLVLYSSHQIRILSLPGRHWKWRMHGGAITLAAKYKELDFTPDLIIVSDMLDLTTFKALTARQTAHIPFLIYFHENQLTYPWSPSDPDRKMAREVHYGFMNYTSALTADRICFNSRFHHDEFYAALTTLLNALPDNREEQNVTLLKKKSSVLSLGLDLSGFDHFDRKDKFDAPLILWNHRWEYDKNPHDFFQALYLMQDKGYDFRLVIVGESYRKIPQEFKEAKEKLAEKIVHYGFCKSFAEYAGWLHKADLLPITSRQDFFGISAVEGIYCNCYPLLPDRLAFGEHLLDVGREQYYYSNFEELCQKLENYLKNFPALRQQEFSDMVIRYDWANMIKLYDQEFENIAMFKG